MKLILVVVVLSVLCVLGNAASEKDEKFLAWFKKNGGIANGVGVRTFKSMGRGVSAELKIESDQEVLRIPSKLILCVKSILASDDEMHTNIAKALKNQDENTVISVLLLEKARGKSSFFADYLNVLPEFIPNLSYYSPETLKQLQSPSLEQDVTSNNKKVKNDYKKFVKAMKKDDLDKNWPEQALPSFQDWKWAAAIIDSRGLRFRSKVHLAPFSDMFNYGAHKTLREDTQGDFFLKHHVLDEKMDALRVYSDRDQPAGTQLLEDYGDNKDRIYLQYHGFVAGHNPFRCVDVMAPSPKASHISEDKRALLKALRFSENEPPSFCLGARGIPDMALMVYMSVVSMDDVTLKTCLTKATDTPQPTWPEVSETCGFFKQYTYVSNMLKTITGPNGGEINELRPDTKRSVPTDVRLFLAHVQEWLASASASEYSDGQAATTLDEDELLLEDWYATHSADDTSHLNDLSALRYRMYAKRHLQNLRQIYHIAAGGELGAQVTPAEQREKKESDADADADEERQEKSKTEEVVSADGSATGEAAKATAKTSETVGEGESELAIGEMAIHVEALEEQLREFNEWFNEGNPAVNKLQAAFIPGWRIGTVATSPIEDGEDYLAVPPNRVMSSDYARAHPAFSELFTAIDAKYGPQAKDDFHELMFALLYEYVVLGDGTNKFHVPGAAGGTKGKKSPFWPYLALLPKPEDQGIVPTQWTDKELQQRIGPSHVITQVLEYQNAQRRQFDTMRNVEMVKDFFASFGEVEPSSVASVAEGNSDADNSNNQDMDKDTGIFASIRNALSGSSASSISDTGNAGNAGTTAKIAQKEKDAALAAIEKAKIVDEQPYSVLSWQNYQWAQAILDSRSIWWEGKRHLVPMLDFINCVEGPDPSRVHSTQVRHVTGISSSKKKEKPSQAVTSASWTFGEGAQVFENYGQANYIYFMYHGFGLPVGKNSHDCVNWRISFSPQERKAMQEFFEQNEKAREVVQRMQLPLSPKRPFLDFCAGGKEEILPRTVWVALALKSGTFGEQMEANTLGQPTSEGMDQLQELLDERIQAYEAHFALPSSARGHIDYHQNSHFFLETELHHLGVVQAHLEQLRNKQKEKDEL